MDVFEADGTYVGRVGLPDLILKKIRGDQVWGYTRDEFEVPYFRGYRVKWDSL